jgi:hypothetical protein
MSTQKWFYIACFSVGMLIVAGVVSTAILELRYEKQCMADGHKEYECVAMMLGYRK